MAFDKKRVFITGEAKRKAPTGHSVELSPDTTIAAPTVKNQYVQIPIEVQSAAGANKATAFNTLLDTLVVAAVDSLISNSIAVDTAGRTVDYNLEVYDITRGSALDDIFFADDSVSYQVFGILSVTVAPAA